MEYAMSAVTMPSAPPAYVTLGGCQYIKQITIYKTKREEGRK
jgi:hypothetical protein